MKMSLQLRRSEGRRPRLGLLAVAVVAAVGAALWFALRGPDARAGAIAGALAALGSTMAALTALHLSREALARTDRQLAHARLVTMLSRYPLLLPVHQSVSFPDSSGALAAHPPTTERFALNPPQAGTYAFVADTWSTLLIPVENAGEGPALQVSGTLWHRDGRSGPLVGPTMVGANRVAIFTVRLGSVKSELAEDFRDAIRCSGSSKATELFWLDLVYLDIFSNPLGAQALFDSRGLGRWHVAASQSPGDKLAPARYS